MRRGRPEEHVRMQVRICRLKHAPPGALQRNGRALRPTGLVYPSMMPRIPSPGASDTVMRRSSKTAPPSTGSSRSSTGPSRSIRVMICLAQASSTAAFTEIFASSMHPSMHSIPYTSAAETIRSALVRPPHFISLMLMRSAACRCMIVSASCGEKTASSASTGTGLCAVTKASPSRSAAFTGCSTSSIPSSFRSISSRIRTACFGVQA